MTINRKGTSSLANRTNDFGWISSDKRIQSDTVVVQMACAKMTRSIRTTLIAILLLLPMTQAPTFASENPTINVLTLVQQSPEHGDATVTVSNKAVRFDAPRAAMTIVASAPTWQISVYSKERKTEFLTSFEAFNQIGFSNLRGVPRRGKNTNLSALPSTKSSMFGMECKTIHLANQKPTGMAPRVLDEMLYMDGKRKLDDHSHGTDIVATVEKYPPQIVAILTRLYDIPVAEGLPIAAIDEFENGRSRFNLKTKSITKTSVPANFFDIPTGYKRLTAFSDVTRSVQSQKNAEDIFQSLGIGDDFGSKGK